MDLSCNILGKLHQGTHSPDAFTNSMHEQLFQMGCADGTKVNVQIMSNIGMPGNVRQVCKSTANFYVGPPTPLDSPTVPNRHNINRSLGDRVIPTNLCFDGIVKPQSSTAFFELWRTANDVDGLNGVAAFGWSFYFGASNPSRTLHMPTKSLVRTIDHCWAKNLDGTYVITVGDSRDVSQCAIVRRGNITRWDDVRSPFKGDNHSVRMTGWIKRVPQDHPTVWYTNIRGLNASLTPFPGSVRQEMSGPPVPEFVGGVSTVTGKNFAINSTATHPSVHAPN
jgi:hypothetical protein